MSSPATNEAMVAAAVARFGRLDAAVLNAGLVGSPPIEAEGAIERFDLIMAVNVRGVVLGIRYAAPALRAAGGGVHRGDRVDLGHAGRSRLVGLQRLEGGGDQPRAGGRRSTTRPRASG